MATGFFGKMPASGDFVARGLRPQTRPLLDRWLTLHLAEPARQPEIWPETGLHALIQGPDQMLALAILPSQDAVGRRFPLAACCPVVSADQAGIENWAAAVFPTLRLSENPYFDPDALSAALQPVPDPPEAAAPLTPPLAWATDPSATPEDCFRSLFG